MHILGISGMAHDSAAARLAGGKIVAAMEEGKLTRARFVEGIPRAAIRYCFDKSEIGWRELDRVAIAGRPAQACLRETRFRARMAFRSPLSSAYFINKAFGEFGRQLNNLRILRELRGPDSADVVAFDHHLCHASSAFFASGYDRALIVTLDERGDNRPGLVALANGSQIREIASIPLPHSPAWVFSQITGLLGFSPHQDEHKTQWLSLSGEAPYEDVFLDMLRRQPRGEPRLNAKYFTREFGTELCFAPKFYRRLQIAGAHARAGKLQLSLSQRANIAASLQKALSVALTEWLESLRAKTREPNLCLAGGLFLNPLLVSSIERNAGFQRVFVQPAAGNEGAGSAPRGSRRRKRRDRRVLNASRTFISAPNFRIRKSKASWITARLRIAGATRRTTKSRKPFVFSPPEKSWRGFRAPPSSALARSATAACWRIPGRPTFRKI